MPPPAEPDCKSPDLPPLCATPDPPPARNFNLASLLILLTVVTCVTTADLLLARGRRDTHAVTTGILSTLGINALVSPFTITGICFHLAGLAAWLQALRRIPLTIAYCFTAVQQATIALGAWLWLGETISPLRWLGITIVMAGVVLLVPTIVQSESATDAPATPKAGAA